jgi:PEGA domain
MDVSFKPKTIYISSQPPGADVFINGAKQSGQTPVTLPLAPGQYNLVLRLQGYETYAGGIQVKNNIQTLLNAEGGRKTCHRHTDRNLVVIRTILRWKTFEKRLRVRDKHIE